jgi:hypothetical protein
MLDSDTRNTVGMKLMTHTIHMGEQLQTCRRAPPDHRQQPVAARPSDGGDAVSRGSLGALPRGDVGNGSDHSIADRKRHEKVLHLSSSIGVYFTRRIGILLFPTLMPR